MIHTSKCAYISSFISFIGIGNIKMTHNINITLSNNCLCDSFVGNVK